MEDPTYEWDWYWPQTDNQPEQFLVEFQSVGQMTVGEMVGQGMDSKMAIQFSEAYQQTQSKVGVLNQRHQTDQEKADQFMGGDLQLYRDFQNMLNSGDIDPHDYGLDYGATLEQVMQAFYDNAIDVVDPDSDSRYLPF